MKSRFKKLLRLTTTCLLAAPMLFTFGSSVQADPHLGQSQNVVIIGGTTLDVGGVTCTFGIPTDANVMTFTIGGCLPVLGPAGELGDFTFTPMAPGAVSAANLAAFDTAVLNVASSAMACNTNTLTPQAQADLVAFVGAGKKLIIYDSECFPEPVDYSWLPYPFQTSNPGPAGAQEGTLTVVEDNLLSTLIADPSCAGGDIHCIDVVSLGLNTDAVGDMNVMTTFDPNWCIDMSGTNVKEVTGPVHTYANFPPRTDNGLIIYNGLDMDRQFSSDPDLRKIWVQELQQPFNPSGLPCSVPVVGITLEPDTDENSVGEDHTVTATVTDLQANPQPGVLVTFTVLSGPNAGATGTCTVNADCTTDVNGQVSFTYTGIGGVGTDQIEACFTDQDGNERCAQVVTKDWVIPPVVNGRMTGGGSVFAADGTRVRHGFTLHCDVNEGPNNLQITWGTGNQFHLENLATVLCSDDPAIDPAPPAAAFDTHQGMGSGRFNGVSGATARWTFTDAGQPGVNDFAEIKIENAGGNVVLMVSGNLDKGNHQAHDE